jgi:DNA-binding transcriptional ArsR family regulator
VEITREKKVLGEAGGKTPSHQNLLKALVHPIRLALLSELSQRNVSPAEFARQLDEPIPNVAYHFRVLEEMGFIEEVGSRPARGSIEHFYRRTATVIFDDEDWMHLPDEARRVVASTFLGDLIGRISEAIQAGTLTAREDIHITWTPVPLDEQGWTEVMRILGSAFEEVGKVKDQAEKRLAESRDDRLLATVALAGFESPTSERDRQPGEEP